MSNENISKLTDESLENVSGGATTKYGYNVDSQGNVTIADKNNSKNTLTVSKAEWGWLLGQYKGPIDDPEYYLSMVPVDEVKKVMAQHRAGQR